MINLDDLYNATIGALITIIILTIGIAVIIHQIKIHG